MDRWRLFALAEDWQHPLEVDEPVLSRMSRDDAQRKFYLGAGAAPSVKVVSSGEGEKNPSGLSIPKAVLWQHRDPHGAGRSGHHGPLRLGHRALY